MTTYVDTSVLAAYYCPEPFSEEAEQQIRSLDPPVISWLTVVELSSALAKKVRTGEMTARDAERVETLFQTHRDNHLYHLVSLHRPDYVQAHQWIEEQFAALRTLDALHLALTARRDLSLITADHVMRDAGTHLDIGVTFLDAESHS